MKIPFAALSAAAAVLFTSQAASAQSIYSATRPMTPVPGQSGWVLVASSMNNFHPVIGNSAIAVNSNAVIQPFVAPSIPTFRPPFNAFRPMPFGAIPSVPPSAQTPYQFQPR